MIKMTLNDESILNLTQEGACYYSDQVIDFDELEKKLSPVTIETDYDTITYKHAKLGIRDKDTIEVKDEGDKDIYIFSIIPISDDELAITEGLDYIAELLLTDEQALDIPYIFDEWDPNGVEYEKDVSRVQYEGYLWKCLQSHTSQISWNPKDANSLWVRIDDPAEEWPEWRQPEGAHDAYAKGAKVTHNKKHWTSDVDNNVWEPGVYGWTESPIETEETA